VTSYAGAKIPWSLPILNFVDLILAKIPLVQKMSWIFTFELVSKK